MARGSHVKSAETNGNTTVRFPGDTNRAEEGERVMSHDHIEEHDLGLAHDLKVIEHKLIERRRALVMMASAGTVGLLAACGGDGTSSGGTTTSTSTTGSTSSTSSTSTTSTTSSTSGGTTGCVALPTETQGPYPADGSNTSSGSTSNVLTSSGVVRSDIRASFLGTTTVAGGVLVTITLTVVNVNATCAPLSGYAVYLWHCDRNGQYSLYDLPTQSYLRGVQVTDASGKVTFTTIFPGCYAGRFPHMHFEVFSSLANATAGRFARLTSQLAMPSAACTSVYADTATYPNSASRFASTTTANDNVFGDNTSAQIAAMTPTFNGTPSAGYTMAATIGIAI
jgi:protocatechuate 3,4-dioxygenase beta subunit